MTPDPVDGGFGPVLLAFAEGGLPTPLPACATCPKAMWYRSARGTKAFCREIRHVMWEEGETYPILHCDGREAALMTASDV